jgi:hypothetical protein
MVLRDDRDELLARADLAALFTEMGYPQGRNRQWPCPNPSHAQTGTTPPVSIGREHSGHLWCCHGCGAGGTVVDLLRLARGMDAAGAFAWLRDRYGASPAPMRPAPRPQPAVTLDPDAGRLTGSEADEVLARYLAWRDWRPDAAEVFGLYPVRTRGRLAVRHPYRVAGEVRWWQDRLLDPPANVGKWDSPKGAKAIPYAVDLADTLEAAERCGAIFVAEGPADVVALWHVHPNVCAIGIPGTANPGRWASMLAGLDVLIVTDPDDAGDKAADELAHALQREGAWWARLRPPVDLDEWRRTEGDLALVNMAETMVASADVTP